MVKATLLVKIEVNDFEVLKAMGISTRTSLFEHLIEPVLTVAFNKALMNHFIKDILEDEEIRVAMGKEIEAAKFAHYAEGVSLQQIKLEGFEFSAKVMSILGQVFTAEQQIKRAKAEKDAAILMAEKKAEVAKAEHQMHMMKLKMDHESRLTQTQTEIDIWKMKKEAGMPVGEKPKG